MTTMMVVVLVTVTATVTNGYDNGGTLCNHIFDQRTPIVLELHAPYSMLLV